MVDDAIKARTRSAAKPATASEARAAAILSELTDLALELARAFQAQALAAVQAGDLDSAGKAEAGFNRTALGIRRAIALGAKLERQREQARHEAEARRDRLQDRKDDRRRAVADGVSRAIGVVKLEARERLTADLWDRLTASDSIDADLADTALPVEALILHLGREIGLAGRTVAYGLDPAVAKARAELAAALASNPPPPPPRPRKDYTPGRYRTLPAADLGLPGTAIYNLNETTGEIFDPDGKLFRKLPLDRPPETPPADTAPPDPGGPPRAGP